MIYGLRFYRASVKVERGAGAPIFIHGRLDDGRSDFDFIFSCIYEALGDLVFIESTEDYFAGRGEKYWAQALQAVPDKRPYRSGHKIGVMPARVLEQFGKSVSDDWNEVILFQRGAIRRKKMVSIARAISGRALTKHEAAQVIFHNWDGVYWEIFCKDSRLTEQLLESHRGNEKLRIYKVDFELDYPDPRNVPLEPA